MKRFHDISLCVLLACGLALLSACSTNDLPVVDPQASWTPEEKQFANQVIGTWCDFDPDAEGTASEYIIYDIQEGGVFDLWSLYFDEENSSEDLYEEEVYHGSWKPLLNIPDRWADDGPLQGVEIRFNMKDLGGDTNEIIKDTLLFIATGPEEHTFVWASYLDAVVAYYNSLSPEEQAAFDSAARRRGFWGWIGQRFINVGQFFVNAVKVIAQPVNMIIRKIQGKNACYASDMSDWMGQIYKDQNPRICDMSIPGTHDSFTYPELTKDVQSWYQYPGVNAVMVRKVKTQGLNIAMQWDAGIRSFDVRIDDYSALVYNGSFSIEKELGIFHGFVYLGITFSDGIDQIVNQVKAHKGETAIVTLKFEGKETEKYYREVYDKVEDLRRQGLVVDHPSPDMRLNQCRGKIIFIQRYGDNEYNLDVRATGWDANSKLVFMDNPANTAPLHVQDLYESDGDEMLPAFISHKKDEIRKCFEASADKTDNTWFFNHGSCYHGMAAFGLDWLKFLDMNYAEMASYINPWTADYVKEHQGKKTGVVVMDFGGTDELCSGLFFTKGIDVPVNVVDNNRHLDLK